VQYYVQRWKIERFHYILKNGCKVEDIQQRTYERVVSMLILYSVIAIYVMELMMISRENPDLPCDIFFDEEEWKILYCAAKRTTEVPVEAYKISDAIRYLSNLGGHRNAPSDGKDGAMIIWQGLFALSILVDLHKFVGQV